MPIDALELAVAHAATRLANSNRADAQPRTWPNDYSRADAFACWSTHSVDITADNAQSPTKWAGS